MRAGSASAATRQSLRSERKLHRGFGRHIRRPKDRKYRAAQAARDFVRRLYHLKAIISSPICNFSLMRKLQVLYAFFRLFCVCYHSITLKRYAPIAKIVQIVQFDALENVFG